jgi:predicted transcriptional regulator
MAEQRMNKKISLLELSKRTDYTTEFLASIETGTIRPTFNALFRILHAMECDIVLRNRTTKKNGKAAQTVLQWEEIGKVGTPNGYKQ